MTKIRKGWVMATLLLLGTAGCADLDVPNTNEPDAGRALTTAGDVESLVAGSFSRVWIANQRYEGPSFLLSAMAFQHSAWPANAGVYFYGGLPRQDVQNNQVHSEYGYALEHAWNNTYKALAAAAAGLKAIGDNPEFSEELGVNRVARALAFGKFVQGMAHASIGLIYDKGFIVDETVETIDAGGGLGQPRGAEELHRDHERGARILRQGDRGGKGRHLLDPGNVDRCLGGRSGPARPARPFDEGPLPGDGRPDAG